MKTHSVLIFLLLLFFAHASMSQKHSVETGVALQLVSIDSNGTLLYKLINHSARTVRVAKPLIDYGPASGFTWVEGRSGKMAFEINFYDDNRTFGYAKVSPIEIKFGNSVLLKPGESSQESLKIDWSHSNAPKGTIKISIGINCRTAQYNGATGPVYKGSMQSNSIEAIIK